MAARGKKKVPSSAQGAKDKALKDLNWEILEDEDVGSIEKENSLAWKVLTLSQVKELKTLDPYDLEARLCEILDIDKHTSATNWNEGAMSDYYVSGFWWANSQQQFDHRQISGFITLLQNLWKNLADEQKSLLDNINYLKETFVGNGMGSVEEPVPTGGLEFFSVAESTLIMNYIQQTFFQHYAMYEFLHTCEQDEVIISRDLTIEVLPPAEAPYPPPLVEAIHIEMFEGSQDVESEPDLDAESVVAQEEPAEQLDVEAVKDILASVSADQLGTVLHEVAKEKFTEFQDEIKDKLRGRENSYMEKIEKIEKFAD